MNFALRDLQSSTNCFGKCQKHEIIIVISTDKCQHPHSPFQCWKMVKCKLVLDESVLSTLHRGGEGQNVYRMIFSNPCDQGCSSTYHGYRLKAMDIYLARCNSTSYAFHNLCEIRGKTYKKLQPSIQLLSLYFT